jgi:hypothetical protein
MADQVHLIYSVTFQGGSRDGQTITGVEAHSHYLATGNGTVGEQFKELSLPCKERIRKLGFVAVHASGGIEREIYQVIQRRVDREVVTLICKFVHVES